MNAELAKIKTFSQAYDRLKEMAAGRSCAVQVEKASYMDNVQLGVYIAGVGWGYGPTWEAAFLALEPIIRALDSDYNPMEAAAGVDEVVNGEVNGEVAA